ncbi:hypothetical protein BC826DRAFT_300275 [Russula brevipes]|nr:hypothetical protein BC826DRAFT_300275 [Russula brevipes]
MHEVAPVKGSRRLRGEHHAPIVLGALGSGDTTLHRYTPGRQSAYRRLPMKDIHMQMLHPFVFSIDRANSSTSSTGRSTRVVECASSLEKGGVTSVCAATVLNLNAILDGRILSTLKEAKPSLIVTPCPRRGSIRELVREEQFMNGFRLLMVGMHMHLRHDMNRCHFYLLPDYSHRVHSHAGLLHIGPGCPTGTDV